MWRPGSAGLALLLVVAAVAAAAPQQPTFKAGTQIVSVFATGALKRVNGCFGRKHWLTCYPRVGYTAIS